MPAPYVFTGGDKNFSLTITINTPEKWDMWADVSSIFMENFKTLFRYAVFDSNKYLIRATPMQTGRLRGGWTALLNKYNIDYSAAFMDVTLVTGHNEPLSQEAIREGMALSSYIDTDFMVTLVNGVDYADYVESGTSKMEGQHFTARTLYKAELIMKNYIENWANQCSVKSEIVEPVQMDEVQV
jgi:hypothetical protein